MRFVAPLVLIAAAFGALSTFALARGSKPAESCAVVEVEPVADTAEICTASEKLCENWLKGRAAYRNTFVKAAQTCG